jgi:photosystem II stability/assembly factor-like uncharacterized protein
LSFRILSIAFDSSGHGWMVGADAQGLRPYIASSSDGGKSWSNFTAHDLSVGGAYTIGLRGGQALLLRGDGALGTKLTPLLPDGGDTAVDEEVRDPQGRRFRGAAYSASGKIAWVAGYAASTVQGPLDQPGVYIVADGVSMPQTFPSVGHARITAIHFSDGSNGIAGGATLPAVPGRAVEPLCAFTRSGGDTWQTCELRTGGDSYVSCVLRARGDEALLAVNTLGTASGALFRSLDAGATWNAIEFPMRESSHIKALIDLSEVR